MPAKTAPAARPRTDAATARPVSGNFYVFGRVYAYDHEIHARSVITNQSESLSERKYATASRRTMLHRHTSVASRLSFIVSLNIQSHSITFIGPDIISQISLHNIYVLHDEVESR